MSVLLIMVSDGLPPSTDSVITKHELSTFVSPDKEDLFVENVIVSICGFALFQWRPGVYVGKRF